MVADQRQGEETPATGVHRRFIPWAMVNDMSLICADLTPVVCWRGTGPGSAGNPCQPLQT